MVFKLGFDCYEKFGEVEKLGVGSVFQVEEMIKVKLESFENVWCGLEIQMRLVLSRVQDF